VRISTPLLPAQGLRFSNVGNRVYRWIGEASGRFSKLLLLLLHLRQAFIVAQYGYVREGLFACLVIEKYPSSPAFQSKRSQLYKYAHSKWL